LISVSEFPNPLFLCTSPVGQSEAHGFPQAGGSMARFGDGEFWSMDRASITPVVCNRMLQEGGEGLCGMYYFFAINA